jgi:hypothetical protein
VVNLSRRFEGLLLQVCAEPKETQTLECLQVAARRACKGFSFFFSKRLRSWRKLRKDRSLSSLKNNEDKL